MRLDCKVTRVAVNHLKHGKNFMDSIKGHKWLPLLLYKRSTVFHGYVYR